MILQERSNGQTYKRSFPPIQYRKGLRYLKHYGLKEFWIRLHERFEPEEVPYGPWYRGIQTDEETLEKQRKRKFRWAADQHCGTCISDTERFLRQMLDSLLAQTYENWELCLFKRKPGVIRTCRLC